VDLSSKIKFRVHFHFYTRWSGIPETQMGIAMLAVRFCNRAATKPSNNLMKIRQGFRRPVWSDVPDQG